jgi:hypothetical protein
MPVKLIDSIWVEKRILQFVRGILLKKQKLCSHHTQEKYKAALAMISEQCCVEWYKCWKVS